MVSDGANLSPRQRRLILVSMTGSLAMIMMDTTVVGVALPEIGRDLGIGEATVAWVVNAYLLAMASLIALGGPIGDLIGKPRAFRLGVITFALSSLGCGFSTSGTMLIGCRVLQAVGAVLMQPASSAIVISTALPGREGRAMGVYIGISMLGLVAGPVLGGFITEKIGWAWIFFINLPIAAFALIMVSIARPPRLQDPEKGLDLPSVGLLVVSVPLAIGSIQQSGVWGLFDWKTLSGVFVGLLAFGLFVHRQSRLSRPLINVKLFRDRGFLADAGMLGFMQFALVGTVIHLSLLTQSTFGFDPQAAGLATLPLVVPVLLLVHFSGRGYDRFGVRPLAIPATIIAGGSVVFLGVAALKGSLPLLFVGMVILGVAMPFVNMPANTDGMRRVGMERRGVASGLLQSVRMIGAALGIAVTAAVANQFQISETMLEGLECGEVDQELIRRAASGDLAALELLGAGLPADSPCLVAVKAGIAEGIGWGFVVAGLISLVALLAALAWVPAPAPAPAEPADPA